MYSERLGRTTRDMNSDPSRPIAVYLYNVEVFVARPSVMMVYMMVGMTGDVPGAVPCSCGQLPNPFIWLRWLWTAIRASAAASTSPFHNNSSGDALASTSHHNFIETARSPVHTPTCHNELLS